MEINARFVLDGSVTIAWSFEDEASDYADAVLASLTTAAAVVPAIWSLEVANALLMGERRNRCTQVQTREAIAILQALPINVADTPAEETFEEILPLARQQNLSAYDAAYLALAMRQGLPLASLDARLTEAANALGVSLYTPPAAPVGEEGIEGE
jgi:predicted nucleic acid-binding protein